MGSYMGNQNPKDWIVTVGVVPVIGFAKDSNIELELREDAVDADTGIQGDWVFVEKNDGSSTIKFTLYRNSASNAALHTYLKTRSVFFNHVDQRPKWHRPCLALFDDSETAQRR